MHRRVASMVTKVDNVRLLHAEIISHNPQADSNRNHHPAADKQISRTFFSGKGC
jgi:hypothetical protein